MFRQKPVRLKLLTPIHDQHVLDELNAEPAPPPGTAVFSKPLECICVRCKVRAVFNAACAERFDEACFRTAGLDLGNWPIRSRCMREIFKTGTSVKWTSSCSIRCTIQCLTMCMIGVYRDRTRSDLLSLF